MKDTIVVKIPSDMNYFSIIRSTIEDLSRDIDFRERDIEDIVEAARELVENSIVHGYKDTQGFIEISFYPFSYGLRIDIRDWGFPMSAKKYKSVPIDLNEDKGFNRVFNLSDKFEYLNLGKDGKKFTIIKYASHTHKSKIERVQNQREKESNKIDKKDVVIKTRSFKEGDEEAISRLIYQNYGHSYLKDLFYYPKKVLELENKKFFSIVALVDDKIVGHFALIKQPRSNIAEIGVVVVNPLYKGLGIMNRMFDDLIKRAEELGFDAIFGEAIMFHIFSQKSNLTHKFFESAILIGKVPAETEIEHNELTKNHRRGSLLVGYRMFNYKKMELNIPDTYHKQIIKTYQNANLEFKKADIKELKRQTHLYYLFEPLANIATIVIDGYQKHFEHKFFHILQLLRAKHCDMIYADINMVDNPKINKIVRILNKKGFFYSGVLFLKYKNKDYLRLQYKHSEIVGKKNLICYSDICRDLLDFIKKDEKRVKKL